MLDTWGFLVINRVLQNPVFDLLMPILSEKHYALLPAAVAILMLGVWGGRRTRILLAVGVVAVVVTDVGATMIRAALHRTRPCYVVPGARLLFGCTWSPSFPSNQASNVFAIATMAWLEFRRWRWIFPALAAALAYSRVYVGVHYPADVIGGALWGAAIGWACTALVHRGLPDWLGECPKEAPAEPS
jgi:undecaprenyl-diphosphatase